MDPADVSRQLKFGTKRSLAKWNHEMTLDKGVPVWLPLPGYLNTLPPLSNGMSDG